MYNPIFGVNCIDDCGGLRVSAAVKTPIMEDDDCSFIAKIISESKVEALTSTITSQKRTNLNPLEAYTTDDHLYKPYREKDFYSSYPMRRLNVSWLGKTTYGDLFYTIASSHILLPANEERKLKDYFQDVIRVGLEKIKYHIYNESNINSEYSFHYYFNCDKERKIKRLKQFGVYKDPNRKTISLLYDGYNILDISDEWRHIIKSEVWDKYKLGRYSIYELKYEFAKYLVNILNNR